MTIQTYIPINDSWSYAEVAYSANDPTLVAYFAYDEEEGDIYVPNDEWLIRAKLLILTGLSPIAAVARIVYHVARTLFLCAALPFGVVNPEVLWNSFLDIGRPLYYGLLMLGATFIGYVNPLAGRKYYALFERTLNRQIDEIHFRKKFYLAICMQPLYRTEDIEDAVRHYYDRGERSITSSHPDYKECCELI